MTNFWKKFLLCLLTSLALHNPLLQPEDYSIIFVHIGKKLPLYAEEALAQARLFNENSPIILLANKSAIESMEHPSLLQSASITAVSCESLKMSDAHKNFIKNSRLNENFREGFWRYTSERFLYLADLVAAYDLKNVFHLEYDNMLYADLSKYLPIFTEHYSSIAATFDNETRCVPGFLYFRDKKSLLDLANYFSLHARSGKNDMELIALYRKEKGKERIGNLPIIHLNYLLKNKILSSGKRKVKNKFDFSTHVEEFRAIFDAAAIGQYLGGIDPRNGHSKPGFINESCIFIASDLTFEWEMNEKGLYVPYATYRKERLPIVNLHIHSKNLKAFSSLIAQPKRLPLQRKEEMENLL